jgi:hypothetical protein
MPANYPSADVLTTGWYKKPGPFAYTALADNTDLTYVSAPVADPESLIEELTSPVLAGTQPVPIRIHVTAGEITARVSLLDDSNNVLGSSDWFTVTVNTPTTITPLVTIASTATRIKFEPGPSAENGIVTENGSFLVTEDGFYLVASGGEQRLAWATWPGGLVDVDYTLNTLIPWSTAIPLLKEARYTCVMPVVATAGWTWYPTSVATQHPIVAGRNDGSDYLAAILTAASASQIDVRAWVQLWVISPGFLAPSTAADAFRAAGRLQLDENLNEFSNTSLCPSVEANRQLEIAMLVELATNYPTLKGITVDFNRILNGYLGSFTNAARARYEAWSTGGAVVNWPADVLGARATDWWLFNRYVYTSFMAEARAALNVARPGFELSSSVYPFSQLDVAQDWVTWVNQGYVDFVMPMSYVESATTWNAECDAAVASVPAGKVIPAMGLLAGTPNWWDTPQHEIPALTHSAKIAHIRASGLPGWALFAWTQDLQLPTF